MHFDIHTKGKSSRDGNPLKSYYNKRALLASSLHEAIFLSENANDICDRLRLIILENQAVNHTNEFDNEINAKVDKVLEYKSITPNQHKQILIKFVLLHTKKCSKTS